MGERMLAATETVAVRDFEGRQFLLMCLFATAVLWLGYRKKNADGKRFSFLYGEDGRRSTSKVTAYVWLVALVGAAGMLLLAVAFSDKVTLAGSGLEALSEDYLFLIGAPLVGLLASKGIVESKVNAGTLQKPRPGETPDAKEGGVAWDDQNEADLLDIQYMSVNGILLVYFVGSVIRRTAIPELPTALVGLSSVSAAAYITRKAIARNPPSLETATWEPSAQGAPAGVLRLRGRNLLRPSAPTTEYVAVDDRVVQQIQSWSADGTIIDAIVSSKPDAGAVITVTTAARVHAVLKAT